MNDILAIRRDLIAFRSMNSRTPALFHRPSDMVSNLEHLQAPADEKHAERLRAGLSRITSEIAAAQRNAGRFDPPHKRTRPYMKRR